jgi:hypothetical protein
MKTVNTIIILLSVILSACSSSQKNPEITEYLATNIRSDGSKEFYYTVTLADSKSSKRGGGGRNVSGGMRVNGGSNSNVYGSGGVTLSGSGGGHKGSRGASGRQPGAQQAEIMTEQLEKKLLASGYCRDCWMETERHVQPPNASIRGECNETATDRDRHNFPNSTDISG